MKEWDESNFNLNYNDYIREAYEAKKWAFITNVVHLYAMVTEGGVYMDANECVCSSSLHGIIIADAYGVPNAWIEFEGGEKKRFASYDYMASVPMLIGETQNWNGINIDLQKLLSVCPFNEYK